MLKFALVLFIEVSTPNGAPDLARFDFEFATPALCNQAAQRVAFAPGVVSAECYRLLYT